MYSKKSSDSQIQGQGEQGYHSLLGETVFEPTNDNRAGVSVRSQAGVNSKGSLLYFSTEISAGTLAIEIQRNI